MIKAMKDFQIPMRVEVDKETASATFGRFTTEAYERGFGTTVGNALVASCSSSLTWSGGDDRENRRRAARAFDDSGATEDVTLIILNIKGYVWPSIPTSRHDPAEKEGFREAKGSDIIHDADISIPTPTSYRDPRQGCHARYGDDRQAWARVCTSRTQQGRGLAGSGGHRHRFHFSPISA